MPKPVYASNGAAVADGMRVTRVSEGGTKFEIMVDEKEERFSEIVLKADEPELAPEPAPEPEPEPTPEPPADETNLLPFATLAHVAPPAAGEVIDFGGQTIPGNQLRQMQRSNVTFRNAIVEGPVNYAISDKLNGVTFENMAFSDKCVFRLVRGLLFENCTFTKGELVLQGWTAYPLTNAIIQNCKFTDAYHSEPITEDGTTWAQKRAKMSALYTDALDGLLFKDNLVDYIAWREGYDPALSIEKPMPPSMYSHGLYIQKNCRNITVANNLIASCASYGIQLRPGGTLQDNVFYDCNAGFFYDDGDGKGNRSLVERNIVAHPADKDAEVIGARLWAFNGWKPNAIVTDNTLVGIAANNLKRDISFAEPVEESGTQVLPELDLHSILTREAIRADHKSARQAVVDAVENARGD